MGGAPPAPSEQRPHPAVHSVDRPCSFPAVSQLPPHLAAQLSVLAGARLLQRTGHARATRAAKRWGPCIVPFWRPRRSPWRCWQTSPLARAGSPAVLQWKERTRQEHWLPHWPRQSRVRGRSSCAAQIAYDRRRSQQGSDARISGLCAPVSDCHCCFNRLVRAARAAAVTFPHPEESRQRRRSRGAQSPLVVDVVLIEHHKLKIIRINLGVHPT